MDSGKHKLDKDPGFSFLIPFRNREVERVKNCLNSIASQSYNIYEVIFVDYGSEPDISAKVQELVQSFGFKYIYTDTRYRFWNQNHALNIGLNIAQNQYIVRLDVDIILPDSFLEKISNEVRDDFLINCKCRYAPKGFKYNGFSENQLADLPISDSSATGLCLIVARERLIEINGFNEYYILWGFDDLDTTRALLNAGLKHHWMDMNSLPLMHQWHPVYKSEKYKNLYKVKRDHFESDVKNNNQGFGKITPESERRVFSILQSLDQIKQIKIEYPSQYSFSLWNYSFLKLSESDYQYFVFKTGYISKTAGSRLYNLASMLNRVLKNLNISYRLTDLEKYNDEYISSDQVFNFVLFFVINYKDMISDYYYVEKEDELIFIVVKY